MLYAALLHNQWLSFTRSFRRQRLWITALVLTPLVLYVVAMLVVVGLFYNRLFGPATSSLGFVGMLNPHLVSALFGAFTMRFFFQRPPRMAVQPYLHLPIRRERLVRYFQVASLASVHNFYPFLFVLPFWARHVLGGHLSTQGAVFWLIGVALCILISHYLNTIVRVLLEQHLRTFVLLAGAFLFVQLVDIWTGSRLLNQASASFFDGLVQGEAIKLAGLAVLTLVTVFASGAALRESLRRQQASTQRRQQILPVALTFGRGSIRNLILLELKMMWRNRRARQYVLISIFVSTAYTALLLSDFNPFFGSLMAAVIGLFASGVFALNYGQLMFAWESRHFDGLLARALPAQQMVLAKLVLLITSCLVLFLASLPLFAWLAPTLIPLHVAFLFYNAGVTSVLMLALAVRNRKRIDASYGNFFNYEGFSMLHWLWVLPTITPPALLLYFIPFENALTIIAIFGLANMLLAWPWSLLLARYLGRRKHLMAAGFRVYDR